jgi:glycosyltransferase involved in cell wall biosynthesis
MTSNGARSHPLISVCIPAYRCAAHIGTTIDSVLAQTFSDFELVIIDDASPDQTAAIVASYPDRRIRLLRNDVNLGPQGNWNRCLREARGTYFKLLPQDDTLAPTCLAKQLAPLEADINSEIALVFCARSIINPMGKRVMSRGYPGVAGRVSGREAIRRSIRRGTNLFGEPGSVLLRKALADKIGEFDGSIGYVIDLDYWIRLLLQGDGFYVDEPLVSFRISGGSWSVAIGKGQTVAYRSFIDRVARLHGSGITGFDSALGKLMAPVNTVARQLIYRALL